MQVSPQTAPLRVKLCGIRSRSDLAVALNAGADALGFIVGVRHRTEDELTPAAAAELVALLPPFVGSVMVTHLQQASPILELIRQVGATTLQLQDGIAPQELQAIRTAQPGVKLIQAIHVGDGNAANQAMATAIAAEPLVDALLLDSRTADRIGGTGQTHDWSVSRRIVERISKPVILAGGLRPENLRAALETVGPAAVDVNSGLEDATGAKDPARAEAFVRICRNWRQLPLEP